MIAALIRFVILVGHARAVYPDAALDRIAVAAAAATLVETPTVRGELLMAIAEHESKLEPRAVSWRRGDGERMDVLWTGSVRIPADGPLACGLASTIAPDRAVCAELMDPARAMAAAVAELAEELAACRGSLRCALSGYAGGGAGIAAWRARRRTTATAFADLFMWRAAQLGGAAVVW